MKSKTNSVKGSKVSTENEAHDLAAPLEISDPFNIKSTFTWKPNPEILEAYEEAKSLGIRNIDEIGISEIEPPYFFERVSGYIKALRQLGRAKIYSVDEDRFDHSTVGFPVASIFTRLEELARAMDAGIAEDFGSPLTDEELIKNHGYSESDVYYLRQDGIRIYSHGGRLIEEGEFGYSAAAALRDAQYSLAVPYGEALKELHRITDQAFQTRAALDRHMSFIEAEINAINLEREAEKKRWKESRDRTLQRHMRRLEKTFEERVQKAAHERVYGKIEDDSPSSRSLSL